jgi:hypothetical protein
MKTGWGRTSSLADVKKTAHTLDNDISGHLLQHNGFRSLLYPMAKLGYSSSDTTPEAML